MKFREHMTKSDVREQEVHHTEIMGYVLLRLNTSKLI